MCLIATPPVARAGSYLGPTYSGGTVTSSDGYNAPYTTLGTASGGHTADDLYNPGTPPSWTGRTVSCSGTITATFTWQPDFPGDTAPSKVYVSQASSASASYVNQYAQGGSATASDGLGDSGQTVSGTKYGWQTGGSTVTVTCSPGASATGASSSMNSYLSCSASVSYSVGIVYPAIQLSGVTKDLNKMWAILIGQPCTSSLVGLPAGWSASNYQWGITGTTFQTWSPLTSALGGNPANANASYYVPGPGPSDLPTASWYWNDINPATPEQVDLSATLNPPPGQGSPSGISLAVPVNVYRPTPVAFGTSGTLQVSIRGKNYGDPSNGYWLWAGPTPSGVLVGMDWTANDTPPPSPAPAYGPGCLELVQIITGDDDYYTDGNGQQHVDPANGQTGLDTECPYAGLIGTPYYNANDCPGMPLTAWDAVSANLDVTFEDYLMYSPPGVSQWVPLAQFSWSVYGNATIPSTNNWADFASQHNGSDVAGTITPLGANTPFTVSNTFPMWTQIIHGSHF